MKNVNKEEELELLWDSEEVFEQSEPTDLKAGLDEDGNDTKSLTVPEGIEEVLSTGFGVESTVKLLDNHQTQNADSRPRFFTRYSSLNLRVYIFDKLNSCISQKTAQKVFNAYDYAEFTGQPINLYCVIHLKDTPEQWAGTGFSRIRRKSGEWLRGKSEKHGVKYDPLYVYSFENPSDNIHVNWCLHVPEYLLEEFKKKLPEWVEKVQGPVTDTTVYIKPIKYAEDSYKSTANYILKGVDPDFAEHFHLEKLQDEKGSQGEIYGKRAGFSQAIGVTAQKKAKFNAKKYRAEKMRKFRATGRFR